jgi:RNA polymerase sigma-70 factor (ECF subfamily)
VTAGGDALDDFAAFVRRHQSRVRAQMRRLARGDAALADDLAQQAFVQAWRHAADFRGEAQPATWLYRIAYRCWLAHLRSADDHLPLSDAAAAELASVADAAHDSDAAARRIDVERALARLPEPERVALIHCFQLDLSHSEAAEVLGWPLGTLKSHVARGKARLATALVAWQPAAKGSPS